MKRTELISTINEMFERLLEECQDEHQRRRLKTAQLRMTEDMVQHFFGSTADRNHTHTYHRSA